MTKKEHHILIASDKIISCSDRRITMSKDQYVFIQEVPGNLLLQKLTLFCQDFTISEDSSYVYSILILNESMAPSSN